MNTSSGFWFLGFSVFGALLVLNASSPRRGPVALLPSWLAAFLTVDLAPWHLAVSAGVVVAFHFAGAFETPAGIAGFLLWVGSCAGLVHLWLPAVRARARVHRFADEAGLAPARRVPSGDFFTPFARRRAGVALERDIEFRRVAGRVLKLDVYRPEAPGALRPALVYLHGGGWLLGDKRNQGLPLCHHLARLGWVCFNANYRLSPGATWPDHLVDAKAAVAWARAHAAEHGADPGFIAVAGGSAGAHIASMAGLTAGDAALQPGFEAADASVQAVVSGYGVYDLTNEGGEHNDAFQTHMMGPLVLKAFPDTEPEVFRSASPVHRIAGDAPPWLVMHGEHDTLAPASEARAFVQALEQASPNPAWYFEFPRAAHAFDIYTCHRAAAAVELAARFLVTARRDAAGGA